MPYLKDELINYTGGEYRVIEHDGDLYVIGYDLCLPVMDHADGDRLVIELTDLREGR